MVPLYRVDFEVMAGELVAVVGTVGAGKSSLIQALLGEMDKTHGQVSIQVGQLYAMKVHTSLSHLHARLIWSICDSTIAW